MDQKEIEKKIVFAIYIICAIFCFKCNSELKYRHNGKLLGEVFYGGKIKHPNHTSFYFCRECLKDYMSMFYRFSTSPKESNDE